MTATATPQPARKTAKGFDPHRFGRALRRLTLPFAVIAGLWFWTCFGAIQVPKGMDTMPHVPPGSVCLVDKRSDRVQERHEVFVEVPGGGTVLSRVVQITPEGLVVVQHDAATSSLPDSRAFGPLPREAVRGIVLCVFAGDQSEPGSERGR